MTTWIIILIIAAAFSGLDQVIRLNWHYRTWLPDWVLTWDLKVGKIDALHTYQGMVYFLNTLGGIFIAIWVIFSMMGTGRFEILMGFWWWGILVVGWTLVVILAWFQVRNLFMHVIWLKPAEWSWPFRSML